MFNKSKCYRGGNKHNFKPRYSEEPRTLEVDFKNLFATPEQVRALFIINKYIYDICEWCGEIKK